MLLEELKRRKSEKVFALEHEKRAGDRRSIVALGSETASLEGVIARIYLQNGEPEKAVINLISQGSCLCDANRHIEARRIFLKAKSITKVENTINCIDELLSGLPTLSRPTTNPFEEPAYILGNPHLRQPQIDAYATIRRYFQTQAGHAIVQLPVGCGKTGLMSIVPFGIAKGRVLALAPSLEIRRNLFQNLDYHGQGSFLKKYSVLKNGGGPACAYLDSEANLDDCDQADIVVTNVQQLAAGTSSKWLSKLSPDFFDMILIDEAHHNVASTWQNALDQFPDAKKISFTATPMRADGKKIEGERIFRFPIAQAIRDGYIKDLASRLLEPEQIYFTYQGEHRKATLEEVLKLRENTWFSRGVALSKECNESIVDASIQSVTELRESGEHQQIIAVACSIDHARAIRSLYEERGVHAEVLHSLMSAPEQEQTRANLRTGQIDAVVHVGILGEGADYPNLSVAAIFRPYRHLMPYLQFVGRVMRVIKPDAPGDPSNRGYVVSHIGLNVDRWWTELRQFDDDDEEFLAELASGKSEFVIDKDDPATDSTSIRRRFRPDMQVIEETITQYVQDNFIKAGVKLLVDDLIQTMNLRGLDFESLGLSRADLERKLQETNVQQTVRGNLQKLPVSPQQARKAAKQRLNERVLSASKQLLNALRLKIGGLDLPKLYPSTGAQANLPAAIILLNKAVCDHLKVGVKERDLLSEQQLELAHDNMDVIIDNLVNVIEPRLKRKG